MVEVVRGCKVPCVCDQVMKVVGVLAVVGIVRVVIDALKQSKVHPP